MALLIGVSVLTGCGSRVDPAVFEELAQGSERASPAPSVPSVGGPMAGVVATPTPIGNASSEQGAHDDGTATPPAQPPPAPTPHVDLEATEDGMPLRLSVEPACVSLGDQVTATIQTEPNARLTLAVAYSDYNPHGQTTFADADGTGAFVWRWTITPDVPPGRAFLLVGAGSRESDESRSEWAEFTVAGPEGTCS